ncbi:MAG: hypothetical protein IPK81_19015 [Rhodospirillales bacterium]|nr:MAG: hypothetical protein IPK81_19015 [Rhodospirillales bacterium]
MFRRISRPMAAALAVAVSVAPQTVMARSEAAGSIGAFSMVPAVAIAVTATDPASAGLRASPGAAVRALSGAAEWSVVNTATAVSVAANASGETLLVIHMVAATGVHLSVSLPFEIARTLALKPGDRVRATTTEAGVALHRDGRVFAIVAREGAEHLVRHEILGAR